ncbi:MAG: hypothetical protein HQL86_01970 [Magnetococcales bacterium]|nr:hypothetical protein [Magnetococcales bacterium]
MMINMELWQLISLLLAFFGFTAAGVKVLVSQFETRLDEKFNSMEQARAAADRTLRDSIQELAERQKELDGQFREQEKEMNRMQVGMLSHYVRREDYVRGQTTIEAKLDALSVRLENLQTKGACTHER